MNTASKNLPAEDLDSLPEIDSFSTSLAPINRTQKFLFGFRDRVCCAGLMVTFVALMRFFLSK